MSSTPKIAIIGAGPGGLTLASILHHNGIPVTIFERETSPTSRSQGGTLDLHEQSGQAALKKAGLFDHFQKHARYEGQDLVVVDQHGKVYVDLKGTDTGRPEIDRVTLRQILLDSLPAETIRWGKQLRKVEVGTLYFDDSTESGFDLIVGADGGWSKVRSLLTPVSPYYSGISGIEIRLRNASTKHPKISKMIGTGSYFAFGDDEGKAMLCQRNGDDSIRVYCFGWQPAGWVKSCGIDFGNVDQVREAFLEEYSTWASELQDLIRLCDDDPVPRELFMLPPGLRWQTKSGLTVIGDAAHIMTPFAGEGVNMAMADALTLADAIMKEPQDLTTAVKKYETWMFPHAKAITQMTWDHLIERFSEGGNAHFKARVEKRLAERAAAKAITLRT